jgi:hypothetical protein
VTLEHRDVQDRRVPVALIVQCAVCRRRDVGYAFFDGPGLWWWRPYPQGLYPHRRARLVANRGGRPRSRTIEGPVIGPVPVDLRAGPGRWRTRCPRHGDLETPELDPATLSPTSTRRLHAAQCSGD